jgi:hypothetical protein
MDVLTNAFCASGMHLPNGSFVTFGGNGAIAPGGNIGSVPNNAGGASFDATYKDFDGTKSIRVLNPCSSSTISSDPSVLASNASCGWYDDPSVLSMSSQRWYSTAEPLADGSIVIIGGFSNGGYINRNYPNIDPVHEGGAANPTYEFFPSKGGQPAQMDFMVTTSGLNAYSHAYLMPSGKMLVQANFSTGMSYRFYQKLMTDQSIDCSAVGLQRKPRDSAARHARQGHSCLSCLWCRRHAPPHPGQQLDSHCTLLRWL